MQITNTTKWQTPHLRAFVTKVASLELDATARKALRIQFIPARQQRYVTGTAWWRYGKIVIHVPTKGDTLTDKLRVDLASVIAHEMRHIQVGGGGRSFEIAYRHNWRYGRPKIAEDREKQRDHYTWALTLPLAKQQPKRKVRASADAKLIAARTAMKRWESKFKRCQTALRKYRAKVRYYERKTVSAAIPTQGIES